MNVEKGNSPRDDPTVRLGEREAVDEGGIWIIGRAFGKSLEILVLLEASADVLADKSSPEFTLFKRPHVEPSDDSKIVGATFERFEEIRVGFCVGIDNRPGCQNNLTLSAYHHNRSTRRIPGS